MKKSIVLLLACFFIACTSPAPQVKPTPTQVGGGGKIAFTSNRNGNYDIYTINPDGSGETRLTTSSAEEMGGDFSPDGQFLIYWVVDNSASPPTNSYWVIKSGDTKSYQLGQGAGKISWSPDQKKVVFNSVWEAGANFDIVTIDLESGTPTRLTTDTESDTTPDWSPDGSTIAFTSFRDGIPHIYLMDTVDGANQRRLTTSKISEYNPEWSPDGKMIAFWSGDPNGTTQVYLINSDGSGLLQLTDTPGLNDGAYFSPDGKMIVFSSRRSGNRELYLVNLDGSGLVQLTHDAGEDLNPSWSSDSRYFVFK